MTLINGVPLSGWKTGLRIRLLLVAVVGVGLAAFAHRAVAQATSSTGGSSKATEDSKDKKQTPVDGKSVMPEISPGVDSDAYRIGLADQLMISVWKEPELSMTVVVRPDGVITRVVQGVLLHG